MHKEIQFICQRAIVSSRKFLPNNICPPSEQVVSSAYVLRRSSRPTTLFVATVSLFQLVASSPPYSSSFPSPAFSYRNLSSPSTLSSLSSTSIPMTKLDSPSAQRNKEPIWQVLSSRVFPRVETATDEETDDQKPFRILEVAAGAGVHTEAFALELTKLFGKKSFVWYPTDPTADALASIRMYMDDNQQLSNVVAVPMPLTLDAAGIQEAVTFSTLFPTPSSTLDLIICINMIHISPWTATLGLMKLAGRSLSAGGLLYCYGPYKVGGTAVESNL